MKHKWTIYEGSRFVDSGTIEGDSESEALNLLLLEQDGKRDADKSYRLTVGGSSASSYGDEFRRTAGASSIDDTQLTPAGHTFAPSLADVGIENGGDMNDSAKKVAEAMAGAAAKEIIRQVLVDNLGIAADQLEGLGHAADGCGKTFRDCAERFDNEQNFGGSPTGKCHHVFKDRACGYDATKSGRMNSSQPNLGQAPKGQDAIVGRALTGGAKGDMIDVVFDDGRIGGGQLGEKCVINEGLRSGANGLLYPPKYATGGIVQPSADVFGQGPTTESRVPIGLAPSEPMPLVSNDVEYHPAPGNMIGGALGEVKRAWINGEEIDPQDPGQIFGLPKISDKMQSELDHLKKLERQMASSMGIPSSIICGAPHCQEVIPVGHLPMGTTSGVPCPGCDATYSVQRN